MRVVAMQLKHGVRYLHNDVSIMKWDKFMAYLLKVHDTLARDTLETLWLHQYGRYAAVL